MEGTGSRGRKEGVMRCVWSGRRIEGGRCSVTEAGARKWKARRGRVAGAKSYSHLGLTRLASERVNEASSRPRLLMRCGRGCWGVLRSQRCWGLALAELSQKLLHTRTIQRQRIEFSLAGTASAGRRHFEGRRMDGRLAKWHCLPTTSINSP